MFKDEQLYRINTFDWSEFAFFKDSGGFDVVMGNPPYGASLYEEEKGYFKANYPNQSYQLDSYLLFVERSLSLLMRHGGIFGMIIPNPWLTNLNQTALREFLISNVSIREIVHFHFQVFSRAKAIVDTQIVLFRKGLTKGNQFTAKFVRGLSSDGKISRFESEVTHSQSAWRVRQAFNIFLDDKRTSLANQIFRGGTRLDAFFKINVGMKPYQVGKGKPAQVRADVEGRVFDAEAKIDSSYRQYLRGSDIEKFIVAPQKERFIKYGDWLAEPRPAADFNAKTKILVRQTGDSLVAARDDDQFLCMNNMHVVVPKSDKVSVEFALGLLNSKMMNWFYHTLNPEMGEALAEVKKENVARLPVVEPTRDNRDTIKRIEAAVTRLVASKLSLRAAKDDHSRKISLRTYVVAQKELNQQVYGLYGLSVEKIAIIEADEPDRS